MTLTRVLSVPVLFILLASEAAMTSARGQTPLDTLQIYPLLPGVTVPTGYRLLRREPIRFEPITISELPPGTRLGQMISLPSGRRTVARAYLAELNKIERRLNAIGYSLRTMPSGRTPEGDAPTTLLEPAIDASRLDQQSQLIQARFAEGPVLRQRDVLDSVRSRVLDTSIPVQRAIRAADSLSEVFEESIVVQGDSVIFDWDTVIFPEFWKLYRDSFDFPLGDPNSAYVRLSGGYLVGGTVSRTALRAETIAEGALFDNHVRVLRLKGELEAPVDEPMTMSLSLRVFGNDVLDLDDDSGAILKWDDEVTAPPLEWGFEQTFMAGPIPVSVEMGIRGAAGLQYYAEVKPGVVGTGLVPYLRTDVYAEAAVDVWFAEAGVRGELTLLNAELLLSGTGTLGFSSGGGSYVDVNSTATASLEMLAGKLSIYCEVETPWGPKGYGWAIWKAGGFEVANRTLWNETSRLCLSGCIEGPIPNLLD